MSVRSRWMFILIGNDETGKTTVQKTLVRLLSNDNRDIRLDCNLAFDITHPYMIRKFRNFSIGNRSYQENKKKYESVVNYFLRHFREADLAFISSHLEPADVEAMINEGHRRFYNVCGIFFSNSIAANQNRNSEISSFSWDERWTATNDSTEDKGQQERQLQSIAETILQMLIERTRGW